MPLFWVISVFMLFFITLVIYIMFNIFISKSYNNNLNNNNILKHYYWLW